MPCRGTSHVKLARVLGVLAASALFAAHAVPVSASPAVSLTDLRAQAEQYSTKLAAHYSAANALTTRYDTAMAASEQLGQQLAANKLAEAAVKAQLETTRQTLITNAVNAYVLGSTSANADSLFSSNVAVRDRQRVYQQTVAGDLAATEATYTAQQQTLENAVKRIASSKALADQNTKSIAQLAERERQITNDTQALLNSINGALRDAIAKLAVERARAAAKAAAEAKSKAAATAAAEAAAAAAGLANAVGGDAGAATDAANQAAGAAGGVAQVSGSSSGNQAGQIAAQRAISQIGVPYVWGGTAAGVGFDCSGLVQWAWAQAGKSIPRVTQSQWARLPHVPLSALQPGDLLFYYNLDHDHQVDHVTMYLGSGPYGTTTSVHAPHTGALVRFAPVWTYGLIGAARP